MSLIWSDPRRRRLLLAGLGLAAVVVAAIAWRPLSQYLYYVHLARELGAEERSEHEVEADPAKADVYVNDFRYTAEVTLGPDGFHPAALAVKPQTKLIFRGSGSDKHRVAVAPGSSAPRYFEPKLDLTEHTVFQTKVEAPGTYSFYDRYNPKAALAVTVAP